jgi:hypothetical protein
MAAALCDGQSRHEEGDGMAKQVKRKARAAEEPRAERTNAGREPDSRLDLAMIVGLLAPERIETLRRQLIDGTAGSIEPLLWKLAYSGPCEPARDQIRWITFEQMKQEWAAEVAEERRRAKEAEGRKAR